MGKATLARRLADEFGTSVSKARQFVTDAGPRRARALIGGADEAAKGSKSFPWKTAIAGGSLAGLGGGALYWREQDIRRVEAMADEAENYNDAMQSIIESDLPPELKRAMADSAADVTTSGGNGGGGFDIGDLIPVDISGITDDIGTMVIALVIVVLIMNALLEDSL